MAETLLHYSASGYCTGCGETLAEMDGIEIGDFEDNLVERAQFAFAKHVEEMHG